MRISIFGLGYVGAVSLACLGRDGHDVTGVDIDHHKLKLIASGKSPIVESGIIDLMRDVVASGRIDVTDDAGEAIPATDLSFICVGTPSKPNGSQSLDALSRLCEQIGAALRSKSDFHTIVVRSTVEPGTVENVVIPLLETHSGKQAQHDFSVCFQPEFLREGSSIEDYDSPPMTVVGVQDQRSAAQLREIFGDLPCKFIETDIRTAETLKYACNTFHGLKISFANEIGRICQALGADSNRVMDLLCEDTQLNISKAYLRPGFAFGGSCLPKDLRALLYMAKLHDVEVPMLAGVLPSNKIHVEHAVKMILARNERSVGVIGLSFKSGTDDLRESPLVDVVEQLIGKGLQLKIYDPEVRISHLIGANKKYIEEVIPHIGNLMVDSVQEAMDGTGIVVVGLQGADIVEQLNANVTDSQMVLDLVGLSEPEKLRGEYRGICWCGRKPYCLCRPDSCLRRIRAAKSAPRKFCAD
jgi:GDP-mannose 6-dehydrogenase